MLLDRPVKVTEDEFDRVVADSDVPVLVDFYADWCGPCKVMAPVLDELARERLGDLLVLKLDTDANPGISGRLGIRSIPTLILLRNGKEAGRQIGAVPKSSIEALVDS
jgi:thioredoxin